MSEVFLRFQHGFITSDRALLGQRGIEVTRRSMESDRVAVGYDGHVTDAEFAQCRR